MVVQDSPVSHLGSKHRAPLPQGSGWREGPMVPGIKLKSPPMNAQYPLVL